MTDYLIQRPPGRGGSFRVRTVGAAKSTHQNGRSVKKGSVQDALNGTATPQAAGHIQSGGSGQIEAATAGVKPRSSTVPANRSKTSQSGPTARLRGGESAYVIPAEQAVDDRKDKSMQSDFATEIAQKAAKLARKHAKKAAKKKAKKARVRAREAAALRKAAPALATQVADLEHHTEIVRIQAAFEAETDPFRKSELGEQLTLERLKRLHRTGLSGSAPPPIRAPRGYGER